MSLFLFFLICVAVCLLLAWACARWADVSYPYDTAPLLLTGYFVVLSCLFLYLAVSVL